LKEENERLAAEIRRFNAAGSMQVISTLIAPPGGAEMGSARQMPVSAARTLPEIGDWCGVNLVSDGMTTLTSSQSNSL
jgi:hypothetical protein